MYTIEKENELIGFVEEIRDEARTEESWEAIELFKELEDREDELVRCTLHPMGSWNVESLTFSERVEFYKNEGCDFFIVDIFKGGDLPYETKRDLDWSSAKRIIARAKANKSVSRVDLVVEDWGGNDDFFFKTLEQIDKTPIAWHTSLEELMNGTDTFQHPCMWKWEGK